jgi:hypothetical protein
VLWFAHQRRTLWSLHVVRDTVFWHRVKMGHSCFLAHSLKTASLNYLRYIILGHTINSEIRLNKQWMKMSTVLTHQIHTVAL